LGGGIGCRVNESPPLVIRSEGFLVNSYGGTPRSVRRDVKTSGERRDEKRAEAGEQSLQRQKGVMIVIRAGMRCAKEWEKGKKPPKKKY